MTDDTAVEAAGMSLLWHLADPLTCQQAHEILAAGLRDEYQRYADARRAYDVAAAGAALEEIQNLTTILAASAGGRDLARRRFLATDRPWPLGVCLQACRPVTVGVVSGAALDVRRQPAGDRGTARLAG